jgi:hypothetical protein
LTSASGLAFSAAELTLLARMAGVQIFPSTPPPELDDAGWKAVGRGLVARGVVHGTLRRRVDDDVAAVLDVVLFAERSLWLNVNYDPGGGENIAAALLIRDDRVVRHTIDDDDTHHFTLTDLSALDEMAGIAADFPEGWRPQAAEPLTVSEREYTAAVQLALEAGVGEVAESHSTTLGYVTALAEGRRLTSLRYDRGPEAEVVESREITLNEGRDALWLMRFEPWTNPPDDGSASVVLAQITVDTARELIDELAAGARNGA